MTTIILRSRYCVMFFVSYEIQFVEPIYFQPFFAYRLYFMLIDMRYRRKQISNVYVGIRKKNANSSEVIIIIIFNDISEPISIVFCNQLDLFLSLFLCLYAHTDIGTGRKGERERVSFVHLMLFDSWWHQKISDTHLSMTNRTEHKNHMKENQWSAKHGLLVVVSVMGMNRTWNFLCSLCDFSFRKIDNKIHQIESRYTLDSHTHIHTAHTHSHARERTYQWIKRTLCYSCSTALSTYCIISRQNKKFRFRMNTHTPETNLILGNGCGYGSVNTSGSYYNCRHADILHSPLNIRATTVRWLEWSQKENYRRKPRLRKIKAHSLYE